MSLTRIGSIGINTGIAFAGVTTIVTLNTANDALSIGATVNVGSGITLGASGDIFATGVSTVTTLKVGSGVTVSSDGDIFATGISTFSEDIKVGSGVTISPDGDGFFTGVITATSYSGIDLSDVTGATGDFSIADKIVHTGDTDTAIRFPAADTVTVETGGAERLRIASDGQLKQTAASGSTIFTFKRSDTNTTGAVGVLNFAASDDHSVANIQVLGDGDNEGAHIVFKTTSDAASSDPFNAATVERLRIDSNGLLLIGTTTAGNSDADDLTIANSAHAGITLRSGTSSQGAIYFSDDTSGAAQYDGFLGYNQSDRAMFFGTAQTTRMRIDSSGRLLIGTTTQGTSGADALTVATTGSTGITIRSGTSNDGNLYFADGTSGDTTYRGFIQYEHSNDVFRFGTNSTEAFRIDSSGKFNVGGTTSDAKFTVIDSSTPDIAMRYNGTSGGHTTRLLFMDKRGVINAQVANNLQNDGVGTAAAHLEFATATGGTLSTAVRITNDGHVRKLRQPIFGYNGSGGWTTISNGNADTLVLNNAIVSSSDYNTSNYRYTVPTTGYYWLGCNLYSKHASADTSSSHYLSGGIRINGSAQTESNTIQHYLNASDGDTGYFISLFHYLNANDYVEVVLQASGADMQYYASHCYFYGWLVA